MVIQIEVNISLFKQEHLFTSKTKVDDPKDTPDAFSLEILVSLEKFVSKFQERREQVISQQEVEENDPMKVSNPMRKRRNLLILLPKIMRTWLKRQRLKISNMIMKY
jgi:hypothetical protein